MLRTSVELLQTPLSCTCPCQVHTWYHSYNRRYLQNLLGRRTTSSQARYNCGATIPWLLTYHHRLWPLLGHLVRTVTKFWKSYLYWINHAVTTKKLRIFGDSNSLHRIVFPWLDLSANGSWQLQYFWITSLVYAKKNANILTEIRTLNHKTNFTNVTAELTLLLMKELFSYSHIAVI